MPFLVYDHHYDDFELIGIFSTREKAVAAAGRHVAPTIACAKLKGECYEHWLTMPAIDEIPLDEYRGFNPLGYTVEVDLDRKVRNAYPLVSNEAFKLHNSLEPYLTALGTGQTAEAAYENALANLAVLSDTQINVLVVVSYVITTPFTGTIHHLDEFTKWLRALRAPAVSHIAISNVIPSNAKFHIGQTQWRAEDGSLSPYALTILKQVWDERFERETKSLNFKPLDITLSGCVSSSNPTISCPGGLSG